METIWLIAIFVIGVFFGYIIKKILTSQAISSAQKKAGSILEEAKQKSKNLLLESRDKALSIIDEAKNEEKERTKQSRKKEEHLSERESLFDRKIIEFEESKQKLENARHQLEKNKSEIKKIRETQLEKLEKIAKLTQDQAKDILMENTELRMKDELLHRLRKLENQASEELEAKAKNILTSIIERCAAPHTVETTTTAVALPNEEMKGRIIGREGRNIKTIEQLTGTEIIIDDTPESILISAFNPIRRQLAKKTLEKLIADGRIHPGRIEETIQEMKKELALDIKKAGEEAAYQAGIVGLDNKLLQVLGRLKYRTSYGQNQLQHALEVSHLAGILAAELGANINICKKGGLLHDIGKALDHEIQGSHPEIGYDLLKKFNISEEVAYMSLAHHEDKPKNIEGVIVKIADAISGSRPGARRDSLEEYIQRLSELENTAKSFAGVEKAYAIQAGREVRVFVSPEDIDDYQATKLARDIANKIEEELKYPGEIRVTIIREKRITEYAR
ncbi:MAG: ribonuclease Y [Candidatus Komeilibacteria bacterium CG11_big_fil_rev_8_21_14_0_20_36_20]|uniref:Ribonuclease Y n=1 Tax=Candidatus Komeilibacteria bacterium CG11_big_fil_rev_8_21_14_0_20_36_20 TaxID=1974477 RepID=A0A2H0NEI5_9BACT|nr:MAG: ribonuclease Y [Candidatus Komeilibacteria bacterium CG11_big_fil_rev_8_21_14_0_20_36_20]PIR81524.1 MAG: ribonuclease Y [Candidatus Komeilibacteria bacterium CG10_big_fil_rev_8_21_14_0_10_36_65]PJC55263.1 MAG: ribonuclease Y [Candidatus Komeilibacteria bacterium CG_4_9_14_0_2_um_filter_36_13]